jgi:GNAT superfamily N-acetyltransferase
MSIRVIQETVSNIEAYESIGIGFEVRSRVCLDTLVSSKGMIIRETATNPWWKDYDDCPEDRPTALPTRWSTANWAMFAAYVDSQRVGGVITARDTPGMNMLEGRTDVALIMDIRIAFAFRGMGIGRALFENALVWAQDHRCAELRVETQDVNVPACRFYAAMGCDLLSAEQNAYPNSDETKLVWRIALPSNRNRVKNKG